MLKTHAKFNIGDVVRHRVHPFRGVVFDIDPIFNNTEEWYNSIPAEDRPSKEQPFYHLLAENETSYYVAYVSEQNLVKDETGDPVDHPLEIFRGVHRQGEDLCVHLLIFIQQSFQLHELLGAEGSPMAPIEDQDDSLIPLEIGKRQGIA